MDVSATSDNHADMPTGRGVRLPVWSVNFILMFYSLSSKTQTKIQMSVSRTTVWSRYRSRGLVSFNVIA